MCEGVSLYELDMMDKLITLFSSLYYLPKKINKYLATRYGNLRKLKTNNKTISYFHLNKRRDLKLQATTLKSHLPVLLTLKFCVEPRFTIWDSLF